jgi:cysteine-rich repeat protein
MTRAPLLLGHCLLLGACGVERLEAIIDMYDTFGTTMTTGDTTTSTGSTADASTSSSADASTRPEDTSTGGLEGSGEESGDTSSGGPPATFCGDGLIDPDLEECDDANDDPDDGCKLCTLDRRAFVSSQRYQGFKLQGLYGADQRCRMLAALANLPRFGTYRAWLSDSSTSAAARMHHSRGRYIRVDGAPIADDWDGLVSDQLLHPLDLTELWESINPYGVWTGTLPTGEAAPDTDFCGDWLDAQAEDLVTIGLSNQVDGGWTNFVMSGCGSESPLYCFEN